MSPDRPPEERAHGVSPARKLARYESDAESEDEATPQRRVKKCPDGKFEVRRLSSRTKRTNDDIHTSIELCPVLVAVMDTPQVQRLKKLRQLGVADAVYMNVNHTRFEHSLGVAHLGERMCGCLARQEKLGITEKDTLCIKLAGLCHDLGHGPFSHIYDGEFITRIKEREEQAGLNGGENPYAKYPPIPDGWRHEDASLVMIDYLLEHLGMRIDETNLDAPLRQIGDGIDSDFFGISPNAFFGGNLTEDEEPYPLDNVLTSRDWTFIKECIIGGPLMGYEDIVGRGHEKEFLYDIVANRHSGLDVDKIDYFARDQRRANKEAGEIDFQLIEDAFVAWGNCSRPEKCFRCKRRFDDSDDDDVALQKISQKGNEHVADSNDSRQGMHLMICYPEKLVSTAMNFFHTRFNLYKHIYYHKSSKPVEFMICDILVKSDLHQLIKSEKFPGGLPISRAMVDAEAYFNLRDSIIEVIHYSSNKALKAAQDLINRMERRDMYKYVAAQEIYGEYEILWKKSKEEIGNELVRMRTRHDGVELCVDDVVVEKCEIHRGAKDQNPVSFMRFLPKREMPALNNSIGKLPEAKEINEDNIRSDIPRSFNKRTIRIYSRSRNRRIVDLLDHTFRQWVETTTQGDNAPMCMLGMLDKKENGGGKRPAVCSQETPVRGSGSNLAQVSVHNDEMSPARPARVKRKIDYADS